MDHGANGSQSRADAPQVVFRDFPLTWTPVRGQITVHRGRGNDIEGKELQD